MVIPEQRRGYPRKQEEQPYRNYGDPDLTITSNKPRQVKSESRTRHAGGHLESSKLPLRRELAHGLIVPTGKSAAREDQGIPIMRVTQHREGTERPGEQDESGDEQPEACEPSLWS